MLQQHTMDLHYCHQYKAIEHEVEKLMEEQAVRRTCLCASCVTHEGRSHNLHQHVKE